MSPQTHQRSSYRRLTLVILVALGLAGSVGCEKGGDEGSSEASGQKTQKADESGEKAGGEVGPEGPASIDNGGITEVSEDPELIKKGEKLFNAKGCGGCHTADKKVTGPALGGVTDRREPEWLARMILHPDEMIKKDPTAEELLAEHMTPMPNQGVKPEEARALIAYLGTMEK